MEDINFEPKIYSEKIQNLRKRAKKLGISQNEIDKCGNDEQCLSNKIQEQKSKQDKDKLKERQDETSNLYDMDL